MLTSKGIERLRKQPGRYRSSAAIIADSICKSENGIPKRKP